MAIVFVLAHSDLDLASLDLLRPGNLSTAACKVSV